MRRVDGWAKIVYFRNFHISLIQVSLKRLLENFLKYSSE